MHWLVRFTNHYWWFWGLVIYTIHNCLVVLRHSLIGQIHNSLLKVLMHSLIGQIHNSLLVILWHSLIVSQNTIDWLIGWLIDWLTDVVLHYFLPRGWNSDSGQWVEMFVVEDCLIPCSSSSTNLILIHAHQGQSTVRFIEIHNHPLSCWLAVQSLPPSSSLSPSPHPLQLSDSLPLHKNSPGDIAHLYPGMQTCFMTHHVSTQLTEPRDLQQGTMDCQNVWSHRTSPLS